MKVHKTPFMAQLEMTRVLTLILSECLEFLMELQVFSLTTNGWHDQPEITRRMTQQLTTMNGQVNELHNSLNAAENLRDCSQLTTSPWIQPQPPSPRDACGRVLRPLGPRRFHSRLPRQRSRSP